MSMFSACQGYSRTTGERCVCAIECHRYQEYLRIKPDERKTIILPEIVGNDCEHFIKENTDDR